MYVGVIVPGPVCSSGTVWEFGIRALGFGDGSTVVSGGGGL